jgi:hypothetical protein
MWQFFADHFWTILGVVTSFGAVGILVAIVFFGLPAAMPLKSVIDFGREAIRFLQTPAGQIVGVVTLCLLSAFFADLRRTRIDQRLWQERQDAAAEAAKQRDESIKQQVEAKAKDASDQLARDNADLAKKVQDYEATLAKRPACALTPDDVRRLRSLD